jgi:hypothetical protein
LESLTPRGEEGKREVLATVYVFNDDAGCGALVGYFFDFVNVFAEASFVVFSNGCNSVAGILENLGQSFVAEGASGAKVLVDVNFNACHGSTSSLGFLRWKAIIAKKGERITRKNPRG